MYLSVNPYQELLDGLLVALQVSDGILKLSGPQGCGKTALCLELQRRLQADGARVLYFGTAPAAPETLQLAILRFLELPEQGNFTRTLTRHLLQQEPDRRQLYLLFDAAETLDESVLEAVRMLCNIQDERQALVRPILCGSPLLERRLDNMRLRSLLQYISEGFRLAPMTQEQVQEFCQAYWNVSGLPGQPTGEKLLQILYRESRGLPGPLLARLERARQRIEARHGGREEESEANPAVVAAAPRAVRRPAMLLAASLAVLAVGAGGWWYAGSGQGPAPVVVAAAVVADTAAAATESTETTEAEVGSVLVDAGSTELAADSASARATALLDAWLGSWQAQDSTAYLAHYHPAFETPNGLGRAEWEQRRRNSISRASELSISWDGLEIVEDSSEALLLRFWLHYRASHYADGIFKELLLVPAADGSLQIRRESNLQVRSPP